MRPFFIVAVAASLCATLAAPVTISNVVPRRDTDGAILDAHDSKLNFRDGLYYWHAASYGNCTEPKGNSGVSTQQRCSALHRIIPNPYITARP